MPSTTTVHPPDASLKGFPSAKSQIMGMAWRPKSARTLSTPAPTGTEGCRDRPVCSTRTPDTGTPPRHTRSHRRPPSRSGRPSFGSFQPRRRARARSAASRTKSENVVRAESWRDREEVSERGGASRSWARFEAKRPIAAGACSGLRSSTAAGDHLRALGRGQVDATSVAFGDDRQ